MGVNLVTRVRNFYVQEENFDAESHEVHDGCVTPGTHRVVRFDFLTYNAGDADFVIGSPADRPDLFVWSEAHQHYHLRDFNEFLLFDANGNLATVGYKQAFCAIDLEPIDPNAGPAQFTSCNSDQGISAGWADVYSSGLACQFVVIDALPDGDYTLQSTTNAPHLAQEDCFADNTIWTGLRIAGNTVTLIEPPFIPEDRLSIRPENVQAAQIGGRWKVVDGDHWMIDTGTSQGDAERSVEIIKHYGLSFMCFVARPRCPDVEPMMYFLNQKGESPSGGLDGEDIIPFNRNALEVDEIGGRWKVVEGTHWLLDFGAGEGNAHAALHFIHKYGFDEICFVGRPHPPMTYFKKRTAGFIPIPVDPRRLDWSMERPNWTSAQMEQTRRLAPRVNFATCATGKGENPRREEGVIISVQDADGERAVATQIIQKYGITGLDCGVRTDIELPFAATAVDLSVAHFGKPSRVQALTAKGSVVFDVKASPRQRNVELVRLFGECIEVLRIVSPNSTTLLVDLRFTPHVSH